MLVLVLFLTFVIGVLVMLKTLFQLLRDMVMPTVTMTIPPDGTTEMSRITCRDCGKVWQNRAEYDESPGCDKGWCLNTKEGMDVARRRGRAGNKPPFIDTTPAEVEESKDGALPQAKIQIHMTRGPVLSRWDTDAPELELIIPDVININIFPRKGTK